MNARDALVRLQEIDVELLRDRRRGEELPQRAAVAKLRADVKRVGAEAQRVVGRHKDLAMALEANAEEHDHVAWLVDRAQAEAAEGRDYRHVRDLEAQLTSLAKRLEKLEFQRAGLEGELEACRRRAEECQAWLKRARAEEAELVASFKAELEAVAARVRELREEREDVVAGMDPALVERYERASERFGGLAVERLVGDTPSVCRVTLQPSQYAAVRTPEGYCECPYCHRILVSDEG